MKKKIKEFIKSYAIGLIFGIVVSGTISVIAATYFPSNDVTYDNSTSGLASTNVQGAIDELYTECTTTPAGEQIIEDTGLEKDPYECRYFFTGANPNNYITFNNEQAGWRIISVECDGTIKIMRTASIEDMVWDSSNSNNWARPASLNTYLNETYYNELNNTAKSQIVAKAWSIGGITYYNNNLATQINDENNTKWTGKVALATVSEYIRANSDKNSCGTLASYLNDVYDNCKNTNWMHNYTSWWTLSPEISNSRDVFYIYYYDGGIGYNDASITRYSDVVRPAVYLSSEVKITGGTGTSSDPYQISL